MPRTETSKTLDRLKGIDPRTVGDLIAVLLAQEPEAVVRVMAFMSYNPSIGRVLQKGGVGIFQDMAVEKVKRLGNINSAIDFDKFHSNWIEQLTREIKRNNLRQCSFGQAHKAINVFLKLYVDWAKLPDKATASKLLPLLHVPLDSILMKTIAKKFPEFFESKIKPLRHYNYTHSLSKIGEEEYKAWQTFFRQSYPDRPILFDIIWALRRRAGYDV
jgi:hypothetical protein